MKPYEVGIWRNGDLIAYRTVKARTRYAAQKKALAQWVAENLEARPRKITTPKCTICGKNINPHDEVYDGLCQECRHDEVTGIG